MALRRSIPLNRGYEIEEILTEGVRGCQIGRKGREGYVPRSLGKV